MTQAKKLFDEAALDVEEQLIQTSVSGLTYIAEMRWLWLNLIVFRCKGTDGARTPFNIKPLTGLRYGRVDHKMDHLACFAGGMFGLAAHEERDENSQRWMQVAKVARIRTASQYCSFAKFPLFWSCSSNLR